MNRKRLPKSYFSFNLNIFKILSIILIIIFVLSTPFAVKRLIKIDKIECVNQFGSCTYEFQLGNYKYVKDQIEKKLDEDVQVNSYLIQYKIPSTVKLDINIKSPKNAIYVNSTNKYYLISEDGLVLSTSDTSSLPVIKIDTGELEIGKVVDEKFKFALSILDNLSFLYFVKEGLFDKSSLRFVSQEGVNIIFPVEGEVDLLVGSLRIIFSRLNDETEGIRMNEIREIDLRYKNPVLRK
jgi:hypothetical protein